MAIHIERETETERIERCDHDGTTEPLAGLASVSICTACCATWPTRFGADAETVRLVVKGGEREGRGFPLLGPPCFPSVPVLHRSCTGCPEWHDSHE